MIKTIVQSSVKLVSVSGLNGYLAYFNFSQIPIYNWVDDVRGVLGVIATFVAIIYGFYQIKLIRKKLREEKKQK